MTDPARPMTVGGHVLDARVLRRGLAAMRPGMGIDYFESWDVAKALLPACRRRGLNASYVADRLLQRARLAGLVEHRGRGQWVRRAMGLKREAARPAGARSEGRKPGPRSGCAQNPDGDPA